jgi:hypothetical protein
MAITVSELKDRKRDYFLARSQGEELMMEPFCYCGRTLEQDYFCTACNHKCQVTLIVCEDPGALALANKLAGSPDFHKFEVEALAM